MSKIRIVLATRCLAYYPKGGGVWAWALQYIQALSALGHEVFIMDLMQESGRTLRDKRRIGIFLERFRRLGLEGDCAVLVGPPGNRQRAFEELSVHGVSESRLREEIRTADVVWNLAWALNASLVQYFKRSVLLDVDPGLLQVSALAWDLKLGAHNVLLTTGTKINDADCGIPKLGLTWNPFLQPIHFPFWETGILEDPDTQAPITSITQWNWPHEFRLGERIFSDSKRDAYLRYLNLPRLVSHPFSLAANIDPQDKTGDIQLLLRHGWSLIAPNVTARTPERYGRFIRNSLCEFGCAKPIYVDLKTGWFSERSATYLACGRPVIVESTGFSDHIETGSGLLTFSNLAEAASALESVISNYSFHQKAARELARAYFSSELVVPKLIEASF
jgi:hypothetical protein